MWSHGCNCQSGSGVHPGGICECVCGPARGSGQARRNCCARRHKGSSRCRRNWYTRAQLNLRLPASIDRTIRRVGSGADRHLSEDGHRIPATIDSDSGGTTRLSRQDRQTCCGTPHTIRPYSGGDSGAGSPYRHCRSVVAEADTRIVLSIRVGRDRHRCSPGPG